MLIAFDVIMGEFDVLFHGMGEIYGKDRADETKEGEEEDWELHVGRE